MMSSGPRDPVTHDSGSDGCKDRGAGMLSLRVISGSLLVVFLVITLGMTGGQVRQLGTRVALLEDERSFFQRRLESFKEDNLRLLSRIRDYQDVLEVAQNSNISLSKRLLNRDMAVEDLQLSIDSILEEKYENEARLNGEIAKLEGIKRDLNARGVALGEAVVAQGKEINQLEQSYRTVSMELAGASRENERLSIENDRYLKMLYELEDKFVSAEAQNLGLMDRFNRLQDRAVILEEEKSELKEELRVWIDSELSHPDTGESLAPGAMDFSNAKGDQIIREAAVQGPVTKGAVANADGSVD